MSGKSKIKHDVFRPHFFAAVRAVPRHATDGKSNFIPRPEKRDKGGTIANARFCIEDTGVRMHGFNNVHKIGSPAVAGDGDATAEAEADPTYDAAAEPDAEENGTNGAKTGYEVESINGTALMHFVLSPVRRAFASHPRIKTFIMVMDKGIFMPRPKIHVQKSRTATMLKTMEAQQIMPITYAPGAIPEIVAADRILPPWIAVRADRTLYYHAISQLFEMIHALYRPPRGCRLIIDCLDMAATAPNSLGEWMHSQRLVLDEYAQLVVARARHALRDNANWWNEARRITYELGHAGHVKSVPICIETSDDGITYLPFPLFNAANNAGEADIEIHDWMTKMSELEQHVTFGGERVIAAPLDERNLEFYDTDMLREHEALAALRGPEPLPLSEQPEQTAAPGDDAVNPCTRPNRGLILTCDTDFLSLTLMWYARFCYKNRATGLNCLDNAPLFAIGECQVLRTGWLQSADDFYVKPKKRKREQGAPPPVQPGDVGGPIAALEVYDIHRLWQLVTGCNVAADSNLAALERVASFVAFCAMCGNDYLAGLYFVSRVSMFKAYKRLYNAATTTASLVHFIDGERLTAVVNPAVYVHFIKSCYWEALMAATGQANKPNSPASAMSYTAVARIVANKYNNANRHMPDEDTLQLMYDRLTWCINYALHGPQSITQLLDDAHWGWRSHTIDVRV